MGLQVPEVPSENSNDSRPRLGIGMDASVTPIPDMPGTSLAQTTDFFYPLVDDPYLQVRYLIVAHFVCTTNLTRSLSLYKIADETSF